MATDIGFADVQSLLDTQFDTLTTLPTVQKENKRRKTSTTTAFSRTHVIPTETELMTIGVQGQSRLNGLYIIDLFYPKAEGTATALADIDVIIRSFEAGLFLQDAQLRTVEIYNSYPTGALPTIDNFYHRQVIVEWWAYRIRNV